MPQYPRSVLRTVIIMVGVAFPCVWSILSTDGYNVNIFVQMHAYIMNTNPLQLSNRWWNITECS